ncbi:MAG: hypothetical protein QW786_00055 [Candidatus Hadarchaeum sp.]
MVEKARGKPDIIGLLSLGFFLVLLGAIFSTNPDLHVKVYAFLKDLRLQEIYPGVKFFAPRSSYLEVYTAAFHFCLALAVFNVLMLGLRFVLREPWGRKAGTASSILFWSGAAFSFNWLIGGLIDWFTFLGIILIFIGGSIVLGSVIRLVALMVISTRGQISQGR